MRAVWVGLACNNACGFCPQRPAREAGESGFFAPGAIAARLDAAAGSGEVVALVGGEPTLHPDLFELARRARRRGARGVVVQTNGRRLAYAAYARELAAAGVTAVDVAVHGSTAAMHDFHTAVAGSFAQTATGLGVARGAGLLVGVTAVLTRSNYRHASEIVRLAVARGARALHLSLARAVGEAELAPSLAASPVLARPHLAEAARLARSLGAAVLVEEHASSPAVRELFAGVGEAAPPPGG
ncbi:MAG: radical SAM protein [Myxococcales bacterium]|nr:MAG: radical SAM protein [Myxococcales bacterium]